MSPFLDDAFPEVSGVWPDSKRQTDKGDIENMTANEVNTTPSSEELTAKINVLEKSADSFRKERDKYKAELDSNRKSLAELAKKVEQHERESILRSFGVSNAECLDRAKFEAEKYCREHHTNFDEAAKEILTGEFSYLVSDRKGVRVEGIGVPNWMRPDSGQESEISTIDLLIEKKHRDHQEIVNRMFDVRDPRRPWNQKKR